MARKPPKGKRAPDPCAAFVGEVLSGKIDVCSGIRLAVERHQRDLKTGHKRGLVWRPEAGLRAIQFDETFCVHSKGEFAGKPLILELWQRFVVGSIFGWYQTDGRRRFNNAWVELPRKNGKTTLAAAIGNYLLIADGEPGAEIYTAATKRDQARLSHSEATRMVKASPHLSKLVRSFKDNLNVESTNSKFEPLGADADGMDGLNVHGAIIDEVHAHKNRTTIDKLETATGSRRNPLILEITTAGDLTNLVPWERHDYARKVLDGIFDNDTLFVFIAAMDDGDDYTDPAVWARCNPNLNVSVYIDQLERQCQRAQEIVTEYNKFLRYHLNRWVEQAERWLPMDDWDKCPSEAAPNALMGRDCFAALDLSSTEDLAALALIFPPEYRGDSYRLLVKHYLPEERMLTRVRQRIPMDTWAREGWLTLTPGKMIDYTYILDDLLNWAADYNIIEVAADPWNATQMITQMMDQGLEVVPVRQGYKSLNEPSKYFAGLVVDHKVDHGGNPVLRWEASNVAVSEDPTGSIKPNKLRSGDKIDGIVAVITGLYRVIAHEGDGGSSIYETRGPIVT